MPTTAPPLGLSARRPAFSDDQVLLGPGRRISSACGPTAWSRCAERGRGSPRSGCWRRSPAGGSESPDDDRARGLCYRRRVHHRPGGRSDAAGDADLNGGEKGTGKREKEPRCRKSSAFPLSPLPLSLFASSRHVSPKKRLGQHFLSDPRILAPDRRRARARARTTRCWRSVRASAGSPQSSRPAPDDSSPSRRTAIWSHGSAPGFPPSRLSRAMRSRSTGMPWWSGSAILRIVGNIPYNITSPLIDRALEPPRPGASCFWCRRRWRSGWRQGRAAASTGRSVWECRRWRGSSDCSPYRPAPSPRGPRSIRRCFGWSRWLSRW